MQWSLFTQMHTLGRWFPVDSSYITLWAGYQCLSWGSFLALIQMCSCWPWFWILAVNWHWSLFWTSLFTRAITCSPQWRKCDESGECLQIKATFFQHHSKLRETPNQNLTLYSPQQSAFKSTLPWILIYVIDILWFLKIIWCILKVL